MASMVLLSAVGLTACRVAQQMQVGSGSVLVPPDFHVEAVPSSSHAMFRLKRNGIPYIEKNGVLNVYTERDAKIFTAEGAAQWQQRILDNPNFGMADTRSKLTINGYLDWNCVTAADRKGYRWLTCVDTAGLPLLFSFAGSSAGENEAEGIVRSTRRVGT